MIVGSIVYGEDAAVANFVLSQIPGAQVNMSNDALGRPLYTALGVVVGGKPSAGVIYHNCMTRRQDGTPYLIEVTVAGTDARWASRSALATLFGYPFLELGVEVMVARVAKSNWRCRKLSKGLGFRETGKVPFGYDAGSTLEDLLIYSMTREQCRWIKKGSSHGQKYALAAEAA